LSAGLLLAAADSFDKVIEHLSPHRYSWAPVWKLGGVDISISNAVMNVWLAGLLVIVVFWVAAKRSSIVPKGVSNLVEFGMNWVGDNIVYSVMSVEDGRVWYPFIAAIFFFILLMNLIGVIPYFGYTPTSNLFATVALAIGVYLIAVTVGMARHGVFKFWKKTLVPEGVPLVLKIFMAVLIEPVSQLARPFSLAVRLWANMLADHLLQLVFLGFIFLASGVMALAIAPFSLAFDIVFVMFGLFVALIQAAIFAFLSALYINNALHPGH
jgi:F-type H+-transporting ATPase subunit a